MLIKYIKICLKNQENKDDFQRISIFYLINYSIPNQFDENKSLEEQDILEETKLILATIYRDYIVSNEERNNLVIQENKLKQQLEEKKRELYNPDSLFKSNISKEKSNINEFSTEMCENEKKGFFSKILKMINNVFK